MLFTRDVHSWLCLFAVCVCVVFFLRMKRPRRRNWGARGENTELKMALAWDLSEKLIGEDSGSSLRTVRPLGGGRKQLTYVCEVSSQFIRHARFRFPIVCVSLCHAYQPFLSTVSLSLSSNFAVSQSPRSGRQVKKKKKHQNTLLKLSRRGL